MNNAMHAVRNKEMGTLKAAKQYGVPRSTLQRLAKSHCQLPEKRLGSRVPVFPPTMENELAQHIKNMESRFFGFTTTELRRVVYQFAEVNHLRHPFSVDKKEAGKDWLHGFMERHPDLSVRQPENTSAARASGFNSVSVGKFFDCC